MPSCIIPLHHGTAMKPAWYVCLKIAGFHGNCFLSQQLLPLSPQKRREGLRLKSHPSNKASMKKHHNLPNPAPRRLALPTGQKPSKNPFATLLRTPARLQTRERRCARPQLETLRVEGKKRHPNGGIVLEYFLSGNSFFSCSPSWQPEPSGSCQRGRSSAAPQGCPLFPAYLLLC